MSMTERTYKVEHVPHAFGTAGPLYEPQLRVEGGGEEIVVRVNTRHPFYTVLYGDLLRGQANATDERARAGWARVHGALDLLLLTLGLAEVLAAPEDQLRYEQQKERVWSPDMAAMFRVLDRRLPLTEEELEPAD